MTMLSTSIGSANAEVNAAPLDDLFVILDENNEAIGMCDYRMLAGEIEGIVKSGKIARVRAGTQRDVDDAFGPMD